MYFYYICTLCVAAAGIPYDVTIGAINEVGQGENETVTAFTSSESMCGSNIM